MRRIVVYGPSGSGKTTTAREIAERLGVTHIELDALMHVRPGWDDASPEEFQASIRAAINAAPNGWVADGNYSVGGTILLDAADTAIWLRLPFRVVYPRLARRTIKRVLSRELLWDTNRERWRDVFSKDSMFVWGIKSWKGHFRKTRARLRSAPGSVRIIVLKTPREVDDFLADLE